MRRQRQAPNRYHADEAVTQTYTCTIGKIECEDKAEHRGRRAPVLKAA
jgi:hypothetical protein